jgi:hypothetical protein
MKKVCLVVLMMIACCAWAEEVHSKVFPTKQDCKVKCEEFMNLAGAGKVDEGFKRLEPYWLFSDTEWTQLQIQTAKQMPLIEPRFGKALGYEFVREEMVKDTILRFTYIQKHEWHLIRWTFIFYKPNDKWLLNACHWDDEIEVLFD